MRIRQEDATTSLLIASLMGLSFLYSNLLERLKRERTFFSKHDLDVQEIIKGELPVSIQSRSVVAHLSSGETILFPVSPHFKKCLERNDEEKEFVSSIQS